MTTLGAQREEQSCIILSLQSSRQTYQSYVILTVSVIILSQIPQLGKMVSLSFFLKIAATRLQEMLNTSPDSAR